MDFERVFNRKKDNSVKWNRYPDDVIPLWVADMDFEAAQPIQDSLHRFIQTKVYGYATAPEELAETIISRFKEKYNWKIEREWIVWTPSVVSSIYATANMLGSPPYGVMTSIPVYHPFLDSASVEGRFLQGVPLKKENDRWTMDFDKMERTVTADTKLFILCNPHNPTGTVFRKEELLKLGEFCEKHNLLICSDEIHADIMMDETLEHFPISSISEYAALNSVNLFSPAKAFNIPGLSAAFAIIPNAEIRKKFERAKFHIVPYLFKIGGDAALAAYSESGDWLKQALKYLRNNHDYLFHEINQISGLKMLKSEATYLAWIDYSDLTIDNFASLLEKNGVGVMEASIFNGEKHIRLNFATQRSLLEEAVKRIKLTVDELDIKRVR